MTPATNARWRGNRFKLLAYVAYLLLVVFYLVLARGFLLAGDVFSALAFGLLMSLMGCVSALFLREYPSWLRIEGEDVKVDFGVLAGTQRFLLLRKSDILGITLATPWPFKVVKVLTRDRVYSWVLSMGPARELNSQAARFT